MPIKDLAAPESVTTVKLADYHIGSPFAEVVHIVRLPDGQFLALSAKDPMGGCTDPWSPQESDFRNPCHGSVYNIRGEVIAGPAVQGLDHFAVRVSAKDKAIYIDVMHAPTPGASKHP
jgi:nitrite reductase/ring-hydroxylating ferredoxin subunit